MRGAPACPPPPSVVPCSAPRAAPHPHPRTHSARTGSVSHFLPPKAQRAAAGSSSNRRPGGRGSTPPPRTPYWCISQNGNILICIGSSEGTSTCPCLPAFPRKHTVSRSLAYTAGTQLALFRGRRAERQQLQLLHACKVHSKTSGSSKHKTSFKFTWAPGCTTTTAHVKSNVTVVQLQPCARRLTCPRGTAADTFTN